MLDKKEYSNYGRKIPKMKLYLDDSFYFVISSKEISSLPTELLSSIPFNEIISALANEELRDNVYFEFDASESFMDEMKKYLYKKLLKKGYSILEVKDYSEKEVFDKFKEITDEETSLNQVMEYFKKMHAIDDERVIKAYIEFNKNSKSLNDMRYKLSVKGFDKELIDRLFEEVEGDSEENLIRDYLAKKNIEINELSYEERQKLFSKFMRKGFGYEVINRVFKSYR